MTDKVKSMSSTGRPIAAIVLAAGKGTRMRSDLPKVLHALAGKPMVAHVLSSVAALEPERVVVVVASGMDSVRQVATTTYGPTRFCEQDGMKHGQGTGAAVKAALPELKGFAGDVLVLFGDTPLITTATLARMVEKLNDPSSPAVVVLGMQPVDPAEYGRLVLNSRNELEEIVEFRDASPVQREIGLCNSGVMAIRGEALEGLLSALETKNAKGEYYLTDIIRIARSRGQVCGVSHAPETEVLGVNSRHQLAQAEAEIQKRLRHRAMEEGATLIAPETVFFSHDTRVAPDVLIHPHVVFGAGVSLAEHVEIKSFSHIDGAKVQAHAVVGPFARLRPGADIGEHAHIGNFVEIKKSTLEAGVKVNHLSYVGDAHIGTGSNIGAGTITCNYDGFDKYHTRIGEHVFVGSNASLVAPVAIGDGAIVAAGSVVTEDVEADALAITRARQLQKPGWAKSFKSGKSKRKVN